MPNVGVGGGDWKHRARRGEAEAAAALAKALSTQLQIEAREKQHDNDVKAVTDSISWRITAPLRRISALRTGARRRRSRGLRQS